MKIMFLLANYGSGGAERTVSYLSEFFAANQHQVEIVVLNGNVFYSNTDKVRIIKADIPSSGRGIAGRMKAIFKRLTFVKKYLKENKPDVVFCMLSETVKYVFGRKKGFQLFTSERNNPATDTGRIGLFFKKLFFYYADGVVFQTERAKTFYSKRIQEKGVVIPNALGNELVFDYAFEGERERKISAIGRLVPQKDYPILIKAFAKVKEKHPNYHLEIYGKGPLEEELRSLAKSLDVGDSVLFQGVSPEAIINIANASCYVLSSKYEGMPNALMEAMAVGLPCVSTDCPNGPAELIQNGKNGLLVPVGDADALANAILKMIEDTDFAEQCGKNASKIKKTHSIENNAKKYLEFILKMNREKNV